MSANEAEAYHRTQVLTFRAINADTVSAFTIPYTSEGVGITLAAGVQKTLVEKTRVLY